MKKIAIALLAALSLTGAACGGEGEPGAPTGGGQTLSPGELPTSSPGAATGTVSEGEASVQVARDLEAEFTSELASPVIYSPPPGAIALRWVEGSNGVGITGPTFTGTRPGSRSPSRSTRGVERHSSPPCVMSARSPSTLRRPTRSRGASRAAD